MPPFRTAGDAGFGGERQEEARVPAASWYALSVLFAVYLVNFVDRQILSILANDRRGWD